MDVYRVPEPGPGSAPTAPAARLTLRYPDGPHDAEALLVDPRGGTLAIVTKGLAGARAYTLAAPPRPRRHGDAAAGPRIGARARDRRGRQP